MQDARWIASRLVDVTACVGPVRLAFPALAVLSMAGCSEWIRPELKLPECSTRDDIPCQEPGMVCGTDFKCHWVCSDTRVCPPNEDCSDDGICLEYTQVCTAHADCRPGWYCGDSGTCNKQLDVGDACGTDESRCLSGICAQGVCCDTECGGCTTCVAGSGIGDGDDGICQPVKAGVSPADVCPAGVACDGRGACAMRAAGESCAEAAQCATGLCVLGTCCFAPCDDTCHACETSMTAAEAGTCAPSLVGLDPAEDCAGQLACDGTGACFGKEQGEECDADYECRTSHCVDGFCCSTECSGLCMACRAHWTVGSDGTCSDIRGGTDPYRECAGDGTCTGKGSCTAGAANGTPCGMDAQCASNHCADGVCCSTACDTACLGCVESMTGKADGTCAPIPEPFDPDGDCLARGGFGCNGAGACSLEKTWRSAVKIEDSSGLPYSGQFPSVAVDAFGNAIAVWTQRAAPSSAAAIAQANRYVQGEGWGVAQAIQNDSTSRSADARVAVDSEGNAIAAWTQSDGKAHKNVWANRYIVGHGWQNAEEIETNAAIIDALFVGAVAIDDAGNAFVVWQHRQDGGVYDIWANRFEAGVGWTGAVLLENDDAGPATSPAIAVSAAGHAIAAWQQSDGTRDNIWARSFAPASGWQAPVLLESDNAGSAGGVAMGMSPSGDAVAVWGQSDGTRSNIWSATYTVGIGWGAAILVERSDAGTSGAPKVAVDSSGSAVAVWSQLNTVWANRFESGRGWRNPVVVEVDGAGQAASPRVAVDAAGNAVAVWTQDVGTGTVDLFANRWPAAGSWGTAVVLENQTETLVDQAGCVAVSPTGEAVVVWAQGGDIWSAVLR